MFPSSGETAVVMRHLVFVILYRRLSGMQGGNMQRKEINILNKIVHQVGFIYRDIQGCTVNKTLKNGYPDYVFAWISSQILRKHRHKILAVWKHY
jgi:hypothetical protein